MGEQQMFIGAISAMGAGYVGLWAYFVHINRVHTKEIVTLHSAHAEKIKLLTEDNAKKIKELTDNYIDKLESHSKDLRDLLVNNAVEQEKQMTIIANFSKNIEKLTDEGFSRRR